MSSNFLGMDEGHLPSAVEYHFLQSMRFWYDLVATKYRELDRNEGSSVMQPDSWTCKIRKEMLKDFRNGNRTRTPS